MRIVFLECKKALNSPILIGLMILFACWNIYFIYDSSYFKEELQVANEIAKTYGIHITDETLADLENEIDESILRLNQLTEEKIGKTYESATEFFTQISYEEQQQFTEDELESIANVAIQEMYVEQAQNIEDAYAQFNIEEIGEKEISSMGITGQGAEILRKVNAKFSERFQELQENREHMQWFFSGKPYRMHSLLFRSVFRLIIIEALILIVLATSLITNFEFENRTQLVTYVTKRGRTIMLDKLFASLTTSVLITTILLTITLGTYFLTFDYSHLWKTSINSGFNWEFIFPYVSWWDWSIGTYLMMGIFLTYVGIGLFSLLTFSVSVLLKNSYFTFATLAIFFIACLIIPSYVPKNIILILSSFNLSTLLIDPHFWWMGTGSITSFKFYELWTVIIWTLVLITFCYVSMKRFRKEDLT